jgi:hypothetical protein
MHGIDIKDKILGFTQKQLFLNPAVRHKLAKNKTFVFQQSLSAPSFFRLHFLIIYKYVFGAQGRIC